MNFTVVCPGSRGSWTVGKALRFHPEIRALVLDYERVALNNYFTFTFEWNSSSPTLQFTVDYSLDGLHWNEYTEDERVKV